MHAGAVQIDLTDKHTPAKVCVPSITDQEFLTKFEQFSLSKKTGQETQKEIALVSWKEKYKPSS